MARRRISQSIQANPVIEEPVVEVVESPIEIESVTEGEAPSEPKVEESQPEVVYDAPSSVEQISEPVVEPTPVQSTEPVVEAIEGVRFEGGLYRVELTVNGTLTYFGSYEYLTDALIVRDKVLTRFS